MFNVEQFVEENSIVINTSFVDENPYFPYEDKELKHCFCNLTGSSVSGFEFYLSYVDTEEGYIPDVYFAVERLLDDVKTFKDCAGYKEFADLLGISEDDLSGIVAYEEAKRLTTLIDQQFSIDLNENENLSTEIKI